MVTDDDLPVDLVENVARRHKLGSPWLVAFRSEGEESRGRGLRHVTRVLQAPQQAFVQARARQMQLASVLGEQRMPLERRGPRRDEPRVRSRWQGRHRVCRHGHSMRREGQSSQAGVVGTVARLAERLVDLVERRSTNGVVPLAQRVPHVGRQLGIGADTPDFRAQRFRGRHGLGHHLSGPGHLGGS